MELLGEMTTLSGLFLVRRSGDGGMEFEIHSAGRCARPEFRPVEFCTLKLLKVAL